MTKVLVDTLVWIDALNGKINWQTTLLNKLIDEDISIVLCPVILQEILQGIKEDSGFELVKEHLASFEMITIDAVDAAYGAADIYRLARKSGITIRKSNDCMIAFYAISSNARLLHNDQDFDKIAMFTSLNIIRNSI